MCKKLWDKIKKILCGNVVVFLPTNVPKMAIMHLFGAELKAFTFRSRIPEIAQSNLGSFYVFLTKPKMYEGPLSSLDSVLS